MSDQALIREAVEAGLAVGEDEASAPLAVRRFRELGITAYRDGKHVSLGGQDALALANLLQAHDTGVSVSLEAQTPRRTVVYPDLRGETLLDLEAQALNLAANVFPPGSRLQVAPGYEAIWRWETEEVTATLAVWEVPS